MEEKKVKIFRMNEYEWWFAPTLEEAIQEAARQTGLDREELVDEDYLEELSDEDMDRLIFVHEAEEDSSELKVTFREELRSRTSDGQTVGMFAASE